MISEKVQFAKISDCQGILDIYGPFIENTAASFEESIPSLEEFQKRFQDISQNYPWLVIRDQDRVAGYAYASTHRKRHAYSWSCETTIYVHPDYKRQGLASELYHSLFSLLKAQGYCQMYAGITLPNPASQSLHKKMGFSEIGTFKKVGMKHQAWQDVAWLHQELNNQVPDETPLSIEDFLNQGVEIKTVDPKDPQVSTYMKHLDQYLNSLYKEEENHLDSPEAMSQEHCHMVGAFIKNLLVGIGGVKLFEDFAEIKRMYIPPLFRGLAIAPQIMTVLEDKVRRENLKRVHLETGTKQQAAIKLYQSLGYEEIGAFGQYPPQASSLFFGKSL